MSICEHQDEYSPRHTHISLQRMLKIWGFYLRHLKPRNNHMYFKEFLWGLIDPTYVKLLTFRRHSLNNNYHHCHSSCQLAGLIRYHSSASGFPCGSAGKESACNEGELGSIPGLERSPGEGKGHPLQCSGLENSMDCIVHGVTKSQTRLRDFHFHFPVYHPLESSQLCEMNTITLSHFTIKKNSVSLNNWLSIAELENIRAGTHPRPSDVGAPVA